MIIEKKYITVYNILLLLNLLIIIDNIYNLYTRKLKKKIFFVFIIKNFI